MDKKFVVFKHGPNITDLIIRFVAKKVIPAGGNIWNGVAFFTNPEIRKRVVAEAEKEVLRAIQAIKNDPGNVYGSDDEEIAGKVLAEIKRRNATSNPPK